MRDVSELARKAASQYGLLTSDDLHGLSVTTKRRAALVALGVLRRERRGLYVFGALDGRWEQELMRACLAGTRRGVVSHRSAQRLWDLRPWETIVEVTVRGGNSPTVDGAVVHRSWDLEPVDITWVEGLPVTSVPRTLCDAGVHHRKEEVARMVSAAIGRDLVTLGDLRAFRARVGRHGRTGVGVLDAVLETMSSEVDKTQSPKEADLLRLLTAHGLPDPVAQLPVVVRGERFRLDLAYPQSRVALEYDGFVEHISPAQFDRDRYRQNLLLLDGWLVLRFSRVDLRERAAWVATQVRHALDNPGVDLGARPA